MKTSCSAVGMPAMPLKYVLSWVLAGAFAPFGRGGSGISSGQFLIITPPSAKFLSNFFHGNMDSLMMWPALSPPVDSPIS